METAFRIIFFAINICISAVALGMLISTLKSMRNYAEVRKAFEKIDDLIDDMQTGETTTEQYLFRLIQLRETLTDNQIRGTKITQLINKIKQWIK